MKKFINERFWVGFCMVVAMYWTGCTTYGILAGVEPWRLIVGLACSCLAWSFYVALLHEATNF